MLSQSDICAQAHIGPADLSSSDFDSAEDLSWTIAFDFADDDVLEPMQESGPDLIVSSASARPVQRIKRAKDCGRQAI
jgi:hypothetical protein